MTEADWLASTDPTLMLEFLRGNTSERKLWLFAVACCRQHWNRSSDMSIRYAVDVRELFADGLIGRGRFEDSLRAARNPWWEHLDAYMHARQVAFMAARCDERPSTVTVSESQRVQCDLQRDIFGNPFRPVTIDPSTITTTVAVLARTIYEDRDFDRLPLLADALQDAGCTDADLLTHCRGPGPHVRGCWVVDLLTGKE